MAFPSKSASLFSNKFVNSIKASRQDGYGFIPLLGAGISAPAGVPIIKEIAGYLNRTICISLGLDEVRNTFWNPRLHEWPRFKDVVETGEWVAKVISALESPPDHLVNSNWVVQEAIGAMADWRSSLQFLSRITNNAQGDLVLNSPDPEVVDRFFLRVIHDGYSPSLAHRTLAALTRLLRVEAILTTNFDELVETAFRQKGEEITSFDVHLNSGLPPYDVLESCLSIVKLHGGRYGLRADYSLDAQPSEADRKTFLSYIAGKRLPQDYELNLSRHSLAPQNHLIVIGHSGDDARIASLLQTAYMHFNNSFRIYWLSYSKSDEEKAKTLVQRTKDQYCVDGFDANPFDTFVIEQNHHTGFFLQELYQQLALGLPTINQFYPSAAQLFVPVQCLRNVNEENEERSNQAKAQEIFSKKVRKTIEKDEGRLVVASSKSGVYGITATASQEFSDLEDDYFHCIWLDLDEASNTEELTEIILDSFARRAGVDEWIPVVHEKEPEGRVKEINRYTTNSQNKWILFLNGRDGAGTSGDNRGLSPNGWLDDVEESRKFVQILKDLSGDTCPNVAVVLLCFEGHILEAINESTRAHHFRLMTPLATHEPETLIEKGMKWVTDKTRGLKPEEYELQVKARGRFLLAMTLLRRSRYLSLTWSWAFHGGDIVQELAFKEPISETRFESSQKWLDLLESQEIIYRKPGGFIWMDTDVRDGLRKELLRRPLLKKQEAEILHGIAEWLQKAFFSSRDPLAAIDTTFYRLSNSLVCLENCHESLTQNKKRGPRTRPIAQRYYEEIKHLSRCMNSLMDAAFLLNTAKHEMLRSGYSKATCRQLEHLRDMMATEIRAQIDLLRKTGTIPQDLTKMIDQIWEQNDFLIELTLRLNRTIAHEVAELGTAFKRHRQWRKFRETGLIEHDPDPNGFEPVENLDLFDSIEWLGNISTFFIAIRNYKHSRASLRLLFRSLGFPFELIDKPIKNNKLQTNAVGLIRIVARWAREKKLESAVDCDTVFNATINGLARSMQLYLVRGQGYHLVSRRTRRNEIDVYNNKMYLSYLKADCCYRAAEELGRFIEEGRTVRNLGDRKKIALCHAWLHEKQRLLTQFGLVRSVLRDFAEAIRRLEEAEAILDTMELGHDSLERGILNLHRAEILTQQAMFRPGKLPEVMTHLGEHRQSLLSIHAKRGAEQCIVYHQNWGKSRLIRKNTIFVKDALREVSKASKSLQKHRKNVWWVTWMFEIRLKAIELCVFASLSDFGNRSLAYLGTESAPEYSLSECDRILADSLRMIRLDVFRLARILESYARCLMCVKVKRLVIISQLEAFRWLKRRINLIDTCRTATATFESLLEEHTESRNPVSMQDLRRSIGEKLEPKFDETKKEIEEIETELRYKLKSQADLECEIEKLERNSDLDSKQETDECRNRLAELNIEVEFLAGEKKRFEDLRVALSPQEIAKTLGGARESLLPKTLVSKARAKVKRFDEIKPTTDLADCITKRQKSLLSFEGDLEENSSEEGGLEDGDFNESGVTEGNFTLPKILLQEAGFDEEKRSLQERQLKMHEKCQEAHAELQNKLKEKKQLETKLENDVLEYVNHVITETSEILDFTANWNGEA